MNVSYKPASVVNYSSNTDHVTESSSRGDLLKTDKVRCRSGIGRVVTSELNRTVKPTRSCVTFKCF